MKIEGTFAVALFLGLIFALIVLCAGEPDLLDAIIERVRHPQPSTLNQKP